MPPTTGELIGGLPPPVLALKIGDVLRQKVVLPAAAVHGLKADARVKSRGRRTYALGRSKRAE